MLITVLTAGSRGDVQPYLALAAGLQQAGHRVRLVANSNFAPLAGQYGLDFRPIDIDSQAHAGSRPFQAWLSSGNFLELAFNTTRVLQPSLAAILHDAWTACQGSDLLIYHHFTVPTAYYISQKLGIPCLPASLYPLPTRAHPALPLNVRSLGGRLNMASHMVLRLFGWQVYRPSARAFFEPALPIPFTGPERQLARGRQPILCCYSPAVVPRPADLKPNVHITGYWFLDTANGWQPSPALLDFLQAGSPPVFVGFASMGDPAAAADTTALVLEALARSGRRGLLVSGWSGLGAGAALPDNVFVLESAPYQWLLPQMAAIVHHGGAGTTGAGLAAGVPNVVIPHFSDNFFWARRVRALGAGPRPIPRRKLSAGRLAQAITEALGEPSYQARAAAVGRQIRAEDGIGRAVAVVERYLSTTKKVVS
jgi:sterol 3beta-glucosyltransferase